MENDAIATIWGFTIADFTALLMVIFTFVTTVANLLLWVSTRRTVTLLLGQVRHQIASSYSEVQHYAVDAHRDIFFGLLNNPTLLESFTQANGLDAKAWELQKVSSFLVNQVMVGHLNFQNGIVSHSHFEGFKRDAQDVFRYKTGREHCENVRVAHSKEFRHFVETELLWRETPSS